METAARQEAETMTPNPEQSERLLALVERVEAATGPDRELDWIIDQATCNSSIHSDHLDHFREAAKPFTASLDAALTLVDPECYWQVGHDGEGRDPSMFAARVFDPLTMKRPCAAVAETAALALTAACLRARARAGDGA